MTDKFANMGLTPQDPTEYGWNQLGFPAPEPISAFPEGSLAEIDGALWGLVSYMSGRPLLWKAEPDLRHVGTFLASYHEAVGSIRMPSNRPSALPVARLDRQMIDGRFELALGGQDGVERFEQELGRLSRDLADIGHHESTPLIIHGDPTTDNVIVEGSPSRIKALIDFDKAYQEAPLADVGFGLFRSGRPEPNELGLDPKRVAAMVAGYCHARHLGPSVARDAVVYMRARGLQLIVRWIRRGVRDCRGTLSRVGWLVQHERDLVNAIIEALGAKNVNERMRSR